MSKHLSSYAPKAPVKTRGNLQALLHGQRESLAAALPKHIRVEHLIKCALLAMTKQPALLQCSQESVLKAVMDAAMLGLDCSGTLGSAWIVPYGQTAQLIPGYRGLIDLARRSGHISRIEANVVYAQDEFRVSFGLNPELVHRPYFGPDRRTDAEDIVCVYGLAELVGGTPQIEVMAASQIESIRQRSKAGDSGPWVTDYSEMARKTVVRRLCKYLPLSTELATAIALADEAEAFEAPSQALAATAGRQSFAQDATPEMNDFEPDNIEPERDPEPHVDDLGIFEPETRKGP